MVNMTATAATETAAREWLTPIRGSTYRGAFAQEVAASLGVNTRFELERDPNNRHDKNAIKVNVIEPHLGNVWIGWIGAEYAKMIAPLMDDGVEFRIEFLGYSGIYPTVRIQEEV